MGVGGPSPCGHPLQPPLIPTLLEILPVTFSCRCIFLDLSVLFHFNSPHDFSPTFLLLSVQSYSILSWWGEWHRACGIMRDLSRYTPLPDWVDHQLYLTRNREGEMEYNYISLCGMLAHLNMPSSPWGVIAEMINLVTKSTTRTTWLGTMREKRPPHQSNEVE